MHCVRYVSKGRAAVALVQRSGRKGKKAQFMRLDIHVFAWWRKSYHLRPKAARGPRKQRHELHAASHASMCTAGGPRSCRVPGHPLSSWTEISWQVQGQRLTYRGSQLQALVTTLLCDVIVPMVTRTLHLAAKRLTDAQRPPHLPGLTHVHTFLSSYITPHLQVQTLHITLQVTLVFRRTGIKLHFYH